MYVLDKHIETENLGTRSSIEGSFICVPPKTGELFLLPWWEHASVCQ